MYAVNYIIMNCLCHSEIIKHKEEAAKSATYYKCYSNQEGLLFNIIFYQSWSEKKVRA